MPEIGGILLRDSWKPALCAFMRGDKTLQPAGNMQKNSSTERELYRAGQKNQD
jgi:hypothetical protein